MAKKAKPGDNGGAINITDAKAVVRHAVPAIINLKKQRKELNAEISALRANVKSIGIPTAALDLAIRMREIDPEDRAAHDQGYIIARDALGLKIQLDFLDEMDHPTPDKSEKPVELKGTLAKAAAKAGMIPDAMTPAH